MMCAMIGNIDDEYSYEKKKHYNCSSLVIQYTEILMKKEYCVFQWTRVEISFICCFMMGRQDLNRWNCILQLYK